MLARIVGNDRHLAWRAWITREADGAESFRIVAEKEASGSLSTPGSPGGSRRRGTVSSKPFEM